MWKRSGGNVTFAGVTLQAVLASRILMKVQKFNYLAWNGLYTSCHMVDGKCWMGFGHINMLISSGRCSLHMLSLYLSIYLSVCWLWNNPVGLHLAGNTEGVKCEEQAVIHSNCTSIVWFFCCCCCCLKIHILGYHSFCRMEWFVPPYFEQKSQF